MYSVWQFSFVRRSIEQISSVFTEVANTREIVGAWFVNLKPRFPAQQPAKIFSSLKQVCDFQLQGIFFHRGYMNVYSLVHAVLPSGLHLRDGVFCEVQGLPWAILWLFMFSGPDFSQQEWRPWICCGIVWCANGSCGGGSPGCSPASTPSVRNAFQVWSKDTAVFPLSMKFSMKVIFKNWLVLFAMQNYKKRYTEKQLLKPIFLQHYFKLINWERNICVSRKWIGNKSLLSSFSSNSSVLKTNDIGSILTFCSE